MKSELHIESNEVDISLLNKELQLVPDRKEPHWIRNSPTSRDEKSVESHIQYWCNLFQYKKDEKK